MKLRILAIVIILSCHAAGVLGQSSYEVQVFGKDDNISTSLPMVKIEVPATDDKTYTTNEDGIIVISAADLVRLDYIVVRAAGYNDQKINIREFSTFRTNRVYMTPRTIPVFSTGVQDR